MTDAFNVAFRLPNLLRRLFAEGAFSQAFRRSSVSCSGNRSDDLVKTKLLLHLTQSNCLALVATFLHFSIVKQQKSAQRPPLAYLWDVE